LLRDLIFDAWRKGGKLLVFWVKLYCCFTSSIFTPHSSSPLPSSNNIASHLAQAPSETSLLRYTTNKHDKSELVKKREETCFKLGRLVDGTFPSTLRDTATAIERQEEGRQDVRSPLGKAER
jgi:hypothetical protein